MKKRKKQITPLLKNTLHIPVEVAEISKDFKTEIGKDIRVTGVAENWREEKKHVHICICHEAEKGKREAKKQKTRERELRKNRIKDIKK